MRTIHLRGRKNSENNSKANNQDKDFDERMDQALSTISKGGFMILAGGMIGRGFGFLNRALIAKFFGPSALGLLALGLMWLGIIRTLSVGGFRSALKKFIPLSLKRNDDLMVRSTIFTIFFISLSLSLIGAFLLFIFSNYIALTIFNNSSLIPILKIIAILIPTQVLLTLITNLFLSFKNTKYKVILKDMGNQILKLPFIILIAFIGGTVLNLAMAYLLTALILVMVGFIILEKKVYPIFKKQEKFDRNIQFTPKRILTYSLPLLFSAGLWMIMFRADTFMLGYFSNEKIVGIYNLMLPIAGILTIFLTSTNHIFFPVISHLHAEKKFEELSDAFRTVLRWDFLLTFPFFIFLAFFSKPLLLGFFPNYVSGWKALTILSIGMMFRSGLGPVGQTLQCYEKTSFILKINSLIIVLNLILNFILIPIYGLIGAAIATSTAYSLNNILQILKVKKILDFEIEFSLYKKYLISSLIPGSFIFLILRYVPAYWWLVTILFFIFLVSNFLLLMLFNGFSDDDSYLLEIADILLKKIGFKKANLEKMIMKRTNNK